MKDRTNRPPPLALAPPKRVGTAVSRAQDSSAIESCRESPVKLPPRQSSSPNGHAGMRRDGSSSPSWLRLAFNLLHLHLCTVLVAALGTSIHDMPDAVGTSTGNTAIAALTFLALSGLLVLPSLLRPADPQPSSLLLPRLALAFILIGISIAWAVRSPFPRVFTPDYRLWGAAARTSNCLVLGTTFLVGALECMTVVAARKQLIRSLGRWTQEPMNESQDQSVGSRQSGRPARDGGGSIGRGNGSRRRRRGGRESGSSGGVGTLTGDLEGGHEGAGIDPEGKDKLSRSLNCPMGTSAMAWSDAGCRR